MEYHEPEMYSHEKVEEIIRVGTIKEKHYMLVGVAYHEQDFNYAFNIIKDHCFSANISLQGLAIECISHLARIHSFLPQEETIDIFSKIIDGPTCSEVEIMGRMDDAIGDLSIYTPEIYKLIKTKYPEYCKKIGCYYE